MSSRVIISSRSSHAPKSPKDSKLATGRLFGFTNLGQNFLSGRCPRGRQIGRQGKTAFELWLAPAEHNWARMIPQQQFWFVSITLLMRQLQLLGPSLLLQDSPPLPTGPHRIALSNINFQLGQTWDQRRFSCQEWQSKNMNKSQDNPQATWNSQVWYALQFIRQITKVWIAFGKISGACCDVVVACRQQSRQDMERATTAVSLGLAQASLHCAFYQFCIFFWSASQLWHRNGRGEF